MNPSPNFIWRTQSGLQVRKKEAKSNICDAIFSKRKKMKKWAI